jgi:hypothetical protein
MRFTGESMKTQGYAVRSIQIPGWMNDATKELARKNRWPVNAQIEIFVEEQLAKVSYKIPDASPIEGDIGLQKETEALIQMNPILMLPLFQTKLS